MFDMELPSREIMNLYLAQIQTKKQFEIDERKKLTDRISAVSDLYTLLGMRGYKTSEELDTILKVDQYRFMFRGGDIIVIEAIKNKKNITHEVNIACLQTCSPYEISNTGWYVESVYQMPVLMEKLEALYTRLCEIEANFIAKYTTLLETQLV
jgi:hypothetical protein